MLRLGTLAVAAAAAVSASGCGGTARYTVAATRECLREQPGLRVRRAPTDDFIASTALGGAMNVRFPDNQVTLTFGDDADEAFRLAQAYRRFRGPNIGIESALEEVKNVVLLWGITPAPGYRQTIHDCLKG